ncbi:deoxyhypusine synthase [Candidatus Woesearchaeota archaeon]|nr:deoxyhypusine synthase [Candidatus Woesearchaeota archaeon]
MENEEQKKEYKQFEWMRRYNTLDDYPQIKGYDFEKGFDLDRFIESLATTGIQATEVSRGIEIINKMIDSKAKIFLSFTSNLISSGLREAITFLVKHKFVDVIVTSAGGVEEDAIKTLRPFVVGSFDAPGRVLFEQGVGRIGNIFAPFDRYLYFERFMNPFFDKMYEKQKELGRPLSTTEFTYHLGLHLKDESSFLYWAARNDIPVFCPALTDGSIGDLFYFQKQKHHDFYIDIVDDHKKMINIVLESDNNGAIILGGGVPKHYVLNANIFKDGLNYAVYVTTAQEFDASDSGGNQQEAMTWAKLKVNAPSVKIKCEATVVFPLMLTATFAKRYWDSTQKGAGTDKKTKKDNSG